MDRMSAGNNKVLVAMSGGVDSAVAAALLLGDGYDVTGVFLCLSLRHDDGRAASRACCSPADAADARRVAAALGIELTSLPVGGAFGPVIDNFVAEYARGRTPNPCVHCNSLIKFGRLLDLADQAGIGLIATGHYARRIDADGQPAYGEPRRAAIARARDVGKDQSYALFGVARERLGRILLPIGELADKAAVRRIARERALPVHDKPDSQEVCFVPGGDYTELLAHRAPQALRPGAIVNAGGDVLGRHNGYAQFTIGQRRGLGVAAGEPMYVTDIDPERAQVTIGPRSAVMRRELTASGANWHSRTPEVFDAIVQIRYNHRGAAGRVRRTGEATFEVHFDEDIAAITPGQAAVVYDGDRLLGGGWID